MEHRQIFLRDILTVLFKRKWLIILFALVVLVGVYIGNLVWPPTYESVAKVQLLRGRETLQPTTPLTDSVSTPLISMTEEDLNSEIEMIYSDDVLRSVVEKEKLAEAGAFETPDGPVRGLLRGIQNGLRGLQYTLRLRARPGPVEGAVEALKSAIAVKAVKDSFTMEIHCRLGTPDLAQRVLRTLIEEYKLKHNQVFSTPEAADQIFTMKTEEIRAEWLEAQNELKQFREQNNVYELDIEKELLLDQYTKAKRLATQLAALDTATDAAGTAASDDQALMATLGRETESTVITELRLRLLELMLRRNEIVTSKGPNHPDTVGINSEIEKATARLAEAIDIAVTTNQKQIQEIEARLKELNSVIDKHDSLVEEAKIKQDAYTFFAERVQEARVNSVLSDAGINNIVVVSQPSLPTNPIRPRKLFNLLLGLIGGIVGGVGLAFFFDWLDHGLKTPEDVEHYLGVPPVGSFFRTGTAKLDALEAQRISAIVDAVYTEQPLQVIQVVSAVAGEQANLVARALAEASAEDPAGPTLLVDLTGDGVKEAPAGRGLFDLVLNGGGSLEDYVAQVGALYVMGRGSKHECPAYIWKSERMKNLFTELKARFTRIVFHVSPVLQSGDAVNLARLTDGIIIVVKADSTRREVVMRAMELLAEAKGRVLGAVLTDRKQIIPAAVYKRL